ncbi:MAG: hypothetical protein H6738_04675 [Alphaproteobacteria bacterium]|nr:hypothetical protein [Alphaproteobacteria bacterium]MCB9696068.1 hypothetical protein [Alphaproteobacteria bacterium]
MLLALLAACQAPFGADRHDLVGFRVAAVDADPVRDGGTTTARVAVIVDGRPFSHAPVDLAWYLLADPDELLDLDPLSTADGVGPEPELVVPADRRVLGLIARQGDLEERAFVELPTPPASVHPPRALTSGVLPLPAMSALLGPELLLDAREALSADPGDAVPPGGALRLGAEVGDEDPLVRWMSTAGTWFELDRHTADWIAGDDLLLDDDELEGERIPLEPQIVTVLALALGDPGDTAFRATEVFVGDAPEGVWVGGRFLPGDGLPEVAPGQALTTTLRADDTSPTGFRLEGGEVTDPSLVADWGTPSLPCVIGHDGPLDPDWWLTQQCFTNGIDGLRVGLIPDPGGLR